MKIGFIGSTFYDHSVAHITRTLYATLKRQGHTIAIYHNGITCDRTTEYFRSIDLFRYVYRTPESDIIEQIKGDRLDCLIELDGMTSIETLKVLKLLKQQRDRPFIVSWLGTDTAPSDQFVDAMLSDRFVSPEGVEQYYSVPIVRMPNCYIATQGFKVGIPTTTRSSLGFDNDTCVYWVNQRPHKISEQFIVNTLEILLKTRSVLCLRPYHEQMQSIWQNAAEKMGIGDRIFYFPYEPKEENARANLGIVDVVLDTYPYNGTTTTLEALYMGIPVVSIFGQTYHARQGYSLLENAGIGLGRLAANDWYMWTKKAIALADDAELRRSYSDRIREGKRLNPLAPLWDIEQFAIDFIGVVESFASEGSRIGQNSLSLSGKRG